MKDIYDDYYFSGDIDNDDLSSIEKRLEEEKKRKKKEEEVKKLNSLLKNLLI